MSMSTLCGSKSENPLILVSLLVTSFLTSVIQLSSPLAWTSFLCRRSLIMSAHMNTFSDLNFSPLQHDPAVKNTKILSTYYMIFPTSTTSNVWPELPLIYLWKLLGWLSGTYGRRSNLCSFQIGVKIVASNVISTSRIWSHSSYTLPHLAIFRSIYLIVSSHTILHTWTL